MIRRDYILRMVEELAQMLGRVVSLKDRQEYEQAMREIGLALAQLEKTPAGDPNTAPLEHWLALCAKETAAHGPLLIAVADLLNEQGELLQLQNKVSESRRSQAIAIGLYVEAILGGHSFVSVELLDRIETLLARVSGTPLPASVLRRLLGYFEARGRFAQAENTFYDWLETGDTDAATAGAAFYERLAGKTDAELERGGLPRAEAEQGRRDLQNKRWPMFRDQPSSGQAPT